MLLIEVLLCLYSGYMKVVVNWHLQCGFLSSDIWWGLMTNFVVTICAQLNLMNTWNVEPCNNAGTGTVKYY